jgi:hypothetical protein
MSRRGDPERIFDAQRQGVRARLTGTDRIQPETADRWLEAWVLEAATRDLAKDGVYWNAGFDWVIAERGQTVARLSGTPEITAGGTRCSEAPPRRTNRPRPR